MSFSRCVLMLPCYRAPPAWKAWESDAYWLHFQSAAWQSPLGPKPRHPAWPAPGIPPGKHAIAANVSALFWNGCDERALLWLVWGFAYPWGRPECTYRPLLSVDEDLTASDVHSVPRQSQTQLVGRWSVGTCNTNHTLLGLNWATMLAYRRSEYACV